MAIIARIGDTHWLVEARSQPDEPHYVWISRPAPETGSVVALGARLGTIIGFGKGRELSWALDYAFRDALQNCRSSQDADMIRQLKEAAFAAA